jgi:serine/threonine protein kinase
MIVETKSVNPETPRAQLKVMTEDVIDLARVLSAEDTATHGVLKCRGYRYNKTQQGSEMHKSFLLMFWIPDNLRNPRSLRDILLDEDFKGQIKHPLNDRLSLAKQLARAVLHVHSKGLVLKNIRPETILLFENADHDESGSDQFPGNIKAFPISLGQALLTGFEKVRQDEADTVPISVALTQPQCPLLSPSNTVS